MYLKMLVLWRINLNHVCYPNGMKRMSSLLEFTFMTAFFICKETKISRLIMDLKNRTFNLKVTRNLIEYLNFQVFENQSSNNI
jgi:hypothetical protein